MSSISISSKLKYTTYFFLLLIMCACNGIEMPESVEIEYQKHSDNIDFNRNVKPILSDKCFICHGPDKNKVSAGLQLHVA